MRACGNCGESGHNRRTCKKNDVETPAGTTPVGDPFLVARSDVAVSFVVKSQESIARNARLVAAGSHATSGDDDDLDEEAKEAIAWYMEKNHPGWTKRQAERKRPEPDDDDEQDA